MKYGFVILHYKSITQTIQCVYSIMKLDSFSESYTVIIDNGSNDESYQKLKMTFSNNANIKLIQNKENLGFSKGNNIGYRYLIDNIPNIQFIIVINNDIVIYQQDFCKKINDTYLKYKFAVAGPDIYTPAEKKHYNPLPNIETNPSKIRMRIKKENKIVKHYKFFYIAETVRKYCGKLFRIVFGNYSTNREGKNIIFGKPLHGSALIFSIDYINKFDKAFYPEPFLFREEDILYAKCRALNINLLYTPQLKVVHEHNASRKLINKNVFQRFLFTHQGYIKADMVYEHFLQELSDGNSVYTEKQTK